jgi:hypothetical protein
MAQVQAITAQLKTAPTQPPEQKTAFDKVRFSHITHCLSYPERFVRLLSSVASLGCSFVCGLVIFFSSTSKCIFFLVCDAGSL